MQKEFRSKLEDLVENVEELVFPASPGFGGFKLFFGEASVAHPAKANIYLLYYLIKKYTGKGEIVFDPMAGTGSTGILASYLGRHSILVELEEKFYRWMVGWHPCDGWSCDKCHERESKKKDLEAKAEDLKARISSSEDLFEKYKLSRELRDVEDELKGVSVELPKARRRTRRSRKRRPA
ncbi:MAG: DNA methyltransferase [Candidatus Bathyarchaeia archaeon]